MYSKSESLKELKYIESYFKTISENQIDQWQGHFQYGRDNKSIFYKNKEECGKCVGLHISMLYGFQGIDFHKTEKQIYLNVPPSPIYFSSFQDGEDFFIELLKPFQINYRIAFNGTDFGFENYPPFGPSKWPAHPKEVFKKLIQNLEKM